MTAPLAALTTALPPELLRATHGELVKFATVKYPRVVGIVTIAIALAGGGLSAWLGSEPAEGGASAAGTVTIGVSVALLVAAIGLAGVTAASAAGEFHYDTMAGTILAAGDRDRVVVAKLLASVVLGLATAAVVAVVALMWLPLFGHPIVANSTAALLLVGGLLAGICWSVLGTGIGLWVGSPTAAVVLAVGWLIAFEPVLWMVLTGIGIPGLATILPGSATVAMITAGSLRSTQLLAPAPAAMVVLVLWAVGVGMRGWWITRRATL